MSSKNRREAAAAGVLVFASAERAAELAEETGALLMDPGLGPLGLRKVIVAMGNGDVDLVVATPSWAHGWRAPLGWTVELDESFPEDEGLRTQALARVPRA